MKDEVVLPIHEIVIPSTKKAVKFNPYRVKHEKILLMAKESKQIKDIYTAVLQILKACCIEPKTDFIDKLPLFDIEILFLRLRSLSVSNREVIFVTDQIDKQEHQCLIDFDKIDVRWPDPIPESIIKVGNHAIKMKYPTASIYQEDNSELIEKVKHGQLFEFVLPCIDSIYKGDTLLKFTKKELENFLDNLDIPTYNKMKNFLINMPIVEYRVDYKNSFNDDRFLLFRSLIDFFLWL